MLLRLLLAACVALLSTGAVTQTATAQDPAQTKPLLYELRTYTASEGKLPDLLKRFREHTCQLFEKHSIMNVGYWIPVDKENGSETTLLCVVSHKDREAANTAWKDFMADPDWKAVQTASEEKGKILAKPPESIYLSSTDFSPGKFTSEAKTTRVFELRTYTTNPGKLPNLHSRFKNFTMRLFEKHGMTNIAYWTPTDEEQGKSNKLIYILAHDTKEAGLKSFTDFRVDPEWVAAKGESEKDGSLTVPQPEGVKSVYMNPTDFSPIK